MASAKKFTNKILENVLDTISECTKKGKKIKELENCVKKEDITDNVNKLELDLSDKCRGCFDHHPEMHYLFTIFDQKLSLADILTQTTKFQCKENDGSPPYLCTKCTTIVIDFFNFKILYQKTQLHMKNLPHQSETEYIEKFGEDEDVKDMMVNETFIDHKDNDVFLKINAILKSPSGDCEECNKHFNEDNPFSKYTDFRKLIQDEAKTQAENRKRKKCQQITEQEEEAVFKQPEKFCRICKIKFLNDEFRDHWDSHKEYVCNECGHKSLKKSTLEIHKLSVHTTIKNFPCNECNKSFKTKPLLKRHQIVHLNPRSYCCEICGQTFNEIGTLRTHIQLKHIKKRDFICSICGLAFPMKSTLDKHINRHNKNRPPSFYCDICASPFRDKSSLTRHHLIKHSETYKKPQCKFCGKSYCSKTKLKYHVERNHSNKPMMEPRKRGPKKKKLVLKSQTEDYPEVIYEDLNE